MKLASYLTNGAASYGIVTAEGVIDVGQRPDAPAPTLRDALADADALRSFSSSTPALAMEDVELLPPVWDTDRIICVGLNYKTHIQEIGAPTPPAPMLFVRFADSLVAHDQPMVRPQASTQFDFEGELAFVIGKGGRHIAADAAMDHVAGYACFNDGTLRDYQRAAMQFLPGKTFWRSGSFGPWLVTPDEVGDLAQLTLTTHLNGVEMQRSTFDDLLFGIPELIAHLSKIMPLKSGDIIATGTTGGIGSARNPPIWMKAGDVVEVAIERVGTLRNAIIDEA